MTTRVGSADAILAKHLGLSRGAGAEFVLESVYGRLQLRDTRDGAPGPLFVDLAAPDAARRRDAGRQLPLARAVGVKRDHAPTVLDATAGLGRDAYTLVALGCKVTAIERSPVVAALLQDGLERVRATMPLLVGDAIEHMRTINPRPEVVYLDPMFPARGKSAAVKKEMQYMQALLDEDDPAPLLEAALKCATKRVVIKRPIHAPNVGAKPNHTFEGKTVRFDVYVV
jgi:16S rRNA (guanine1516-N2)-methyltransferase